MKKIVYLLMVLCMGSMGFAQSYDYDRIPPEQHSRQVWFTVTTEAQEVSLPNVAAYGHMTLLEHETDIGDMILQFKQIGDNSASLQVITSLKDGMDETFRSNNPVQFLIEENGETVVSIQGAEKEYTLSYMIKMVWKDWLGKVHKQYIGKIY